MHFIAKFLVDHETMDDAQFAAVMDGEPTVEELEAMTAERERVSREENDRRRKIEEEEAKKRAERENRDVDGYDRKEKDDVNDDAEKRDDDSDGVDF